MAIQAAFLKQARACAELGSPFMGRLMALLADHWPDDTALAQRFNGWDGDIGPSGASLPLRLAGGLHALVLSEQDASLAAAYPPNLVSDTDLLAAVLGAMRRQDEFLCQWVESAPQTNEVRRSAVLIAAALWLDARFHLPLRLSELGASAGLNLMFDRFALRIGSRLWGPPDTTVQLAPDWTGEPPPQAAPRIVERRGVDLNPLRVGNPEDVTRLLSYLWPDQADRIALTRAAIDLQDAEVDRGDASEWLAGRLAAPWPGRLHLIYHTVAWQYFPADRQARGRALIEETGAAATDGAPLAWLGMEADGVAGSAAVTLRLWPGDLRLALGRADFHGRWVEWTGG